MLRIATFNLENLFMRPAAMNNDDAKGTQAVEDHATANAIAAKEVYDENDKKTLVALSKKYKWHITNPPKNALVQLQKIRGQLFREGKNGLEVVADGRESWVGWFELLMADINWKATENTGKVISEVKPDILVLIEIENRPTLKRFNEQILKAKFAMNYKHYMVIDGNDDRGIDIGILSRFPLVEIRSHVDDPSGTGLVFSRDCPEYDIILPGGERIVVIANHFKSKRNGNTAAGKARRKLQADRAHEIAVAALKRSKYVLVAGDLNDSPKSPELASLFKDGFEDVSSHQDWPKSRPGTYGNGAASNKLDYLIMSPELKKLLKTTGIERRGTYYPKLWQPFDTVTKSSEEASDHHLVWADFDFG